MPAVAVADLPAGSLLFAKKTAGVWDARPTTRTDVMVLWMGADPGPVIVSSGTGGAYNGDEHHVTP